MNSLAPTREHPLAFELHATPDGNDGFGIELAEVSHSNGTSGPRMRLDPTGTARVMSSVLAALRDSKLRPGLLSPNRDRPLKLAEPAGIRLALVLLATAPLSRRSRVGQVEDGIAAMSTEESYYWYSKCTSADASRARRALRLLLADG